MAREVNENLLLLQIGTKGGGGLFAQISVARINDGRKLEDQTINIETGWSLAFDDFLTL
jgi:hypothetical protein